MRARAVDKLMFEIYGELHQHHIKPLEISDTGQRKGDIVEIDSNDGPGIPERDWERVFTMFSSLKSGRGGDAPV